MNNNNAARLLDLGLKIPELLLPRASADLSAWAVIACDQFTQDPAYWERVRNAAGDKPSTLNLIFPELYLAASSGRAADGQTVNSQARGREGRIAAIHRTMNSYLAGDVFAPPFTGGIYLERDTPFHKKRRGLVLAVDLERYDWREGTRTLIRATEDTAPERLPPRMDIRRGAPLETPHVLLLIADPRDSLLGGLAGLLDSAGPAYRGNLMLDSGSVTGWRVDREDQWAFIADQLEAMKAAGEMAAGREETPAEEAVTEKRAASFLYAVGDGNHSLAAAKGVWEEYKKAHGGEPGLMTHPGRFALVEIENIYDPAISFEPIHRIVFNADIDSLLGALAALPGLSVSPVKPGGLERLRRLVGDRDAPRTRLGLISGTRLFLLETGAPGLATVALQPLLDRFAGADHPIDYIHGGEELIRLAAGQSPEGGAAGILLPPIRKEGFFETVAHSGPLPRKSFSMGESVEKRFYLECRRLYGQT
ncbi:MAG: DUF1015 domain-containing protein [Treponema sp.]|nr:DUF1015 domain-containing protein [Treponema sp.]